MLLFDARLLAAAALWMIFGIQRGWPFWLGQALLAVFYFHNFAIMHEAGHGNIYRRDFVNVIVGHYGSLFCFLPFYPWRYIHHEHHTWTGNPEKDPTMKQIQRMKAKKRVPLAVRFTWRSWIPFGAVLQQYRFLVLSDHRVPRRQDEAARTNPHAHLDPIPRNWLHPDCEVRRRLGDPPRGSGLRS